MRFFLGDIKLSSGILSNDEASTQFYFVPDENDRKDSFYTIIVIDRNSGLYSSFLHCLITNVQATNIPNGDIIVPYIPCNEPYHRYNFFAFSQQMVFTGSNVSSTENIRDQQTKPLSNLQENDRSRFSLDTFVRENDLLPAQKAVIIHTIPRHIDPEDEDEY
jgi:phosphatidylethanolamine-binding protein (PEBP) family uncharacterized protein